MELTKLFSTYIFSPIQTKIRTSKLSKISWKRIAILVLIIALSNLFLMLYVNSENTVHTWDDVSYQATAINLTNISEIKYYAADIHNSMQTDYPSIAVIPIAAILKLFQWDGNRLGFILAIFNVYLLPAILICGYIIGRILGKNRYKILVITTIISVTSTIIMTPVILGRIDTIGLLMISLIALVASHAILEKPKVRPIFQLILHIVLIALLIALLVICRRTFAYWAVSTAIAGCIVTFFYTNKKQRAKQTINYLVATTITAIISIGTILLISRSQFERLFENYRELYQANHDGLFAQLFSLSSYIGIIILCILIICAITAIRSKNHTVSKISFLAIIQTIIVIVMFLFTQNLDEQHYYLFAPSIIFLMTIAAYQLIQNKEYKLILLMQALILINFLNTYAFGVNTLLLSKTYPPEQRTDMSEIQAMSEYTQALNGPVYFVTSSQTLNNQHIKYYFLPKTTAAKNVIMKVSYWDIRDGFQKSFWSAKYVVIEKPFEFSKPTAMRIPGILYDYITTGRMENLKLIKEFPLQNGASAQFYENTANYDPSVVDEIDQAMRTYYPNSPHLWAK